MKLLNYTNEVLDTKHVSNGEQYYPATSSNVTSNDNRAIIVGYYTGVILNLDAFRNESPCAIYNVKMLFNLQNSLNSDKYNLVINSSDIMGIGVNYVYYNGYQISPDRQGTYKVQDVPNNKINTIEISFIKLYDYNGNMQVRVQILYDEKITNLYVGNDQTVRKLSDYYNYRLNLEHKISELKYYENAKYDGCVRIGRCTITDLDIWMSDSYHGIQINFNSIMLNPCTQQEVVFVVDFRKKIKSSKYNLVVRFEGLMYYSVYLDNNQIGSSSNEFYINDISNDKIHYISTNFIKTGSSPYWLYMDISYKEEETIASLPNANNKRLIDTDMNELNITHNNISLVPSFTYIIDGNTHYTNHIYANNTSTGLSIIHDDSLSEYIYFLELDFGSETTEYSEIELCVKPRDNDYEISAYYNSAKLELDKPVKFNKTDYPHIDFHLTRNYPHPSDYAFILDLDILIKNSGITVNKYLK